MNKLIKLTAISLVLMVVNAKAIDKRVKFIAKDDAVKVFLVDGDSKQSQVLVKEKPSYSTTLGFVSDDANLKQGANKFYIKDLVVQTTRPGLSQAEIDAAGNKYKRKTLTTKLDNKQIALLNNFLLESSEPARGQGLLSFFILRNDDTNKYEVVPAPGFNL